MKNYYLAFTIFMLSLAGCTTQDKPILNGEQLLKDKCSSCHNLDMPPKSYEGEKAPSIMAVTFHIRDFIKVNNPSEKRPKFIEFVKDFVIHPSMDKAFCDKDSLKSYGLMPSQKGKVTQDELEAIASFMFRHYNQDDFMSKMEQRSQFLALSKGEQLIRQYGCISCHGVKKPKAGPSFITIASQNSQKNATEIAQSIKVGGKGKYEGFRIAMPPFNKIDQKDRVEIAKWILGLVK